MPWKMRVRGVCNVAGLLLILSLAGCDRDEPKVYRIPKDDSTPPPPVSSPDTGAPSPPTADASTTPAAASAMGSPTPAPSTIPQLKYKVPEGWQEKPPSDMRVASLTALGSNGQSADISAIPLPIVGRDMELVNMWRGQVQLPPTTDPSAVKQAESIPIGSDQGRLFGFVSDKPMIGKGRQRIYVATVTRGPMSWFFKMAGEDAFVLSQKDKFLQFLKSVSFEEGAPDQMASAPMMPAVSPAAAPQTGASDSIWTVPPDWKPMPPSQFLLAEFSVAAAGGAKAEVNVAAMGGEGGGLLANVNRWRGQIGLGPLSDDDLQKTAEALTVPDGKATLVDFSGVNAKTGTPTRLVGVVLAQNGQTWFYKLMGDKEAVAQQKDAFTKFIQSANYANAR